MKEQASNKKIALLFVVLYLLVLTIFSESQALTNYGVVIPFIKFNPVYLLLAIITVGCLSLFLHRTIKVDIISLFLFLRILLCIIPLMTNEIPASYLGNFAVACFPFFIYLFFKNSKFDIAKATSILLFFAVIFALQCVLAYIMIKANGYANYSDPFYKNYFVIPIGATNNASAALLPLLIIGDQVIPKARARFLYAALLIGAIFLCKSRTGMILSVVYLLYKLFIAERGKHSTAKKIMIFLMPLVAVLMIFWLINSPFADVTKELLLGYSSEGEGLNALFSGRFSLFGDAIEHIKQHPIFGNGVSYEKLGFMRTHNVFLQMTYENGIVGLLCFVAFLTVCFKRIYKCRNNNNYCYAFYIAAPFILMNAMVEESLLTNFMVMLTLLFLGTMNEKTKETRDNV